MAVPISTNTPFQNDLMDILRLFYPNGGAESLWHRHTVEDGYFVERVGKGAACETEYVCPAVTGGRLQADRAVKRAAKISLYRQLKAETGMRPPWGSLTGIRPTRMLYELIETGLDVKNAAARLVALYDVDEARARLLADIYEMQRGLIERAPDEYDVYVGIPFCVTRCAYCSFSSAELGRGNDVAGYLSALRFEMERSAALAQGKGMRPRSFYMGGGTPTALTAVQLDETLERARALFGGAAEWTVEAGRPDTIDPDKLSVLKRRGVTRISVNPQSFSDETLARIGRNHTARDTFHAYRLAREAGFDDINMDLIAALPGETVSDFESTLRRAVELEPESITVHTLALKRGSAMNERRVPHTDAAQQMVDRAREALMGEGYRPYYLYRQKYMAGNLENVGYAKRGHACRYNVDIMEEIVPVLALGAGAITKWLFPGERRIERAPNVKNVEQYVLRVAEMVERKRKLIMEEKDT